MLFPTAVLALPFLAQSVLAATCNRKYTVQPGDICDSISTAKNVSTYQLSAINPGVINSDCSNLTPGKELCLGYDNEDCATTYTVVKDDTCEQIAANHQVNATIFRLNNPQLDQDCGNLYVGEVLCTSNQVQVPAAPAGGSLPGATIPVTAAPAKPTSTQVSVNGTPVHPTVTPAPPAPPKPSAPAPSKGDDNDNDDDGEDGDDDDDDDVPFCDEL